MNRFSAANFTIFRQPLLLLLHPRILGQRFSTLTVNDLLLKYMAKSLSLIFTDMPPFINSRAELVDELIARVQHYHIIRVSGTPASGKTTVMNLMVNKLLEKYGQTIPIHVLSGWDRKTVRSATGWAVHLEQETGVHGRNWLTYPAYLLLDEAQQSYWDDELWADLFKRIEPGTSPFIVLFMLYGSPHRGFVGFDGEEHIKTPMVFGAEQQISLRPEESISDHGLGPLLPWKPVGLLLDENEAIDVVTRYAFTVIRPSLSLTPDLKKGFFLSSNGHVGLLTSLTRVLQDVPVSLILDSRVRTKW